MDSNKELRRFLSRVAVGSDEECWAWSGSVDSRGYGMFGESHGRPGRFLTRKAHRVAYSLMVGDVGPDDFVLHRCDNPRCVNPAHLFLGDVQKNATDMAEKWRGRTSKSGLPFGVGVRRRRNSTSYVASVRHLGERHYLGSFGSVDEAAKVAEGFKNEIHRKANFRLRKQEGGQG